MLFSWQELLYWKYWKCFFISERKCLVETQKRILYYIVKIVFFALFFAIITLLKMLFLVEFALLKNKKKNSWQPNSHTWSCLSNLENKSYFFTNINLSQVQLGQLFLEKYFYFLWTPQFFESWHCERFFWGTKWASCVLIPMIASSHIMCLHTSVQVHYVSLNCITP